MGALLDDDDGMGQLYATSAASVEVCGLQAVTSTKELRVLTDVCVRVSTITQNVVNEF